MKSLQDQLKNAGLVDDQKAKRVASDKRKQAKAKRKAGGKSEKPQEAEGSAMRDRNAERDRALNRAQQEARDQKAIAAQIRQLITTNEINAEHDDVAYNFVHDGKVKTLHVDHTVQRQLIAGHLVIVVLRQKSMSRYATVPRTVANKIAERDEDAVIRTDPTRDPQALKEDDPYAAFEVPDDLMW